MYNMYLNVWPIREMVPFPDTDCPVLDIGFDFSIDLY